MTTTVRLLATYDGSPPQTIRDLPDALATSFVAQGSASLDLTGGARRYRQGPILSTVLTQALRGTATLKENEQTTLYLPEGSILNVSANSQANGDIQVKDAAGNMAQALPLSPSVFGAIGPYPGVCQVIASCKSGEVQLTASVNLAGAARQVSGVPQGVMWAGVSPTPAIDFYVLGFSAQPTIFLDPSASTSKNLGTLENPFTTQQQVQLACSGDMSGQVLGVKRGTTLRVTGTDGLALDCYGTPAKPFIVCPYGDAVALPIITAGIVRNDWVQHSGSIYKITGVTQNTDVFQDEKRLWKKSTVGALSVGSAFYDSAATTLYIWSYGSVDPNTVTTEIQGADFAINVRYSNVAASGGVRVVGMDCRKARNISLRASRPTVFAAMTSVAGLGFIGCRAGQAGYDAVGLTNAADAILLYGASDAVRATNSMIIGCEGYDCLNNAFEVANVDGLIHDSNYGHDAGGNTVLEAWSSCSNMKVRNNYGLRSGNTGRIFTNYHNGGIWATTYNDVAGGANQSHAAFQNNLYEFNIIAESQGQCIQIDGGTGNKIYHNTLYNSAGTPTNRMLNLFTYCPTPGTADADVSNNLLMCGSSNNRIMVDIVQGTVATTEAGAIALTATVTGNNNAYLAWAAPTAQLRVRTAAGVTLNGQSGLAAYKTAAAPFDAAATSNWTTPDALIGPAYRPRGAMLTGGKTGMSARRYKDGFAYDPASCAVGAFGS